MGAGPRTTDFLKECISDALYRLLAEKELSRITVAELTKRAGVGRATYFRHFSSKEDVLCFKLVRLWERYAAARGLQNRSSFDIQNAGAFFDFNYGIRDRLRLLYGAGLEGVLFQAFADILVPRDIYSESWYREKFYSYGLYGLLDGWIRKDFRETPREMAKKLLDIMRL